MGELEEKLRLAKAKITGKGKETKTEKTTKELLMEEGINDG